LHGIEGAVFGVTLSIDFYSNLHCAATLVAAVASNRGKEQFNVLLLSHPSTTLLDPLLPPLNR